MLQFISGIFKYLYKIQTSEMSSALEEREEQSLKCFVCNIKVTTRSSYDIYCTFMPQRELLLIDVMSKILKKVLNPSLMRSSVLCRRQVLFHFVL